METYLNISGKSNIESYEIGNDYIIVQFKTGKERIYKYNYEKPGQAVVEQMKDLARAGCGLNSYISKYVKSNFYSKF